jgi:hypothetical protein
LWSICDDGPAFARQAPQQRATAHANGMPRTRQVFVPQPVVDLFRQKLRVYIEGKDAVTGRPFM